MENQNDLVHWGILGMKWGIRRYRNPDGSLTSAGKQRYAKYSDKANKYSEKMEKLSGEKSSKKRLDLSQMSDQQLRNFIYRTRLEQEYKKLYNEYVNPPKVEKGKINMQALYNKAIGGLDMATKTVGLAKAIYDLQGSKAKSETAKFERSKVVAEEAKSGGKSK